MNANQDDVKRALDWMGKHGTKPRDERAVLVLDDPNEQTEGGLYVPTESQLAPVSGIVVASPDGKDLGRRVYFRPHTAVVLPLGHDPRHAVDVAVVHVKDIMLVEEALDG
jgi:co-chaperonin GroES (HSP10)